METVHQFHVGYITDNFLKKHRTLRDQVIKIFQSKFKLFTLKCIKNKWSKNNLSVLLLVTFHENRRAFMYKLIGAVIYTIIHEYICLDYLGLIPWNLSKQNSNFKNTNFSALSRMVIPEILMNIMSYHVSVKSSISTVILIWKNALLLYYLSNGIVIVET